ncbi:hypothetical protein M406DRAFT_332823 [Cryphonectria parasitica EP155]|uniref:Uncharacterized protein n=1 Tax=Cryphonectria parasitica (strain ATCC 38755 / EP155) TaxID=660469 RepID=A0A9P4XW79_CRYP1|nr:uncharacterized protein M406DRAFT_332823 [Cryphonectria parasitica EP155]KAF3762442.1 hypothetical protein M406DRAFT_332823 [Cryphonectria parasitica EP155]
MNHMGLRRDKETPKKYISGQVWPAELRAGRRRGKYSTSYAPSTSKRETTINFNNISLTTWYQGSLVRIPPSLAPIAYSSPERKRIAEILSDLDEDLPDEQIVKRKIEAINAWVAYAFISTSTTVYILRQTIQEDNDYVEPC